MDEDNLGRYGVGYNMEHDTTYCLVADTDVQLSNHKCDCATNPELQEKKKKLWNIL